MSKSRKPSVPRTEQLKLINECRQSGLTDAVWCRKNNIASSTFYNWISRCRAAGLINEIEKPNYGHTEEARPKQDVVPVDIIPEIVPEQPEVQSRSRQPYLDNSHTIEIEMQSITIRISNDADPVLLSRTLRMLQEGLC